jgi:hypothetical protein
MIWRALNFAAFLVVAGAMLWTEWRWMNDRIDLAARNDFHLRGVYLMATAVAVETVLAWWHRRRAPERIRGFPVMQKGQR